MADGRGQTVALIDAYDYPSAEADLAVYRIQYDLPACTTANGCFTKVNENGASGPLPQPAPLSSDWTAEEALDMDMVSAICPNCRILLVEGFHPTFGDLGAAVNAAVAAGAKFVSNSYAGNQDSADNKYDNDYYNHPGVVMTAASGDGGYGVEYPAASPYVTAVGGTSLAAASSPRGWSESAWSTSPQEGAGSGCSAYEPKPVWQADPGCKHRTIADVSAVADPATGVEVYDSFNNEGGWNVFGGTSVGTPIIASVYALAGTPARGSDPASFPYSRPGNLNNLPLQPPRTGAFDAWLGGAGASHADSLAQTVTIPASATAANVSFWLHIGTAESSATACDLLWVQVLSSSGAPLETLADFSNLDAAAGYVRHSFSLTPYAGQTVTLKFSSVEDVSGPTSFVVDDAALTVS